MKLKKFGSLLIIGIMLTSCENSQTMDFSASQSDDQEIALPDTGSSSEEDKEYWYHNAAEITSYKLTQARYGELHEGTAVFVFVTEPFSTVNFTKADSQSSDNVSVLKLNQTRKFTTGIYPYSMMTSSFFPFKEGNHSIKVSSSMQEWCGHVFMDLRTAKSGFNASVNSYFEGESYADKNIPKALLEDDVWSLLRLRTKLPIGKVKMYPSQSYARLMHKEFKPYSCEIELLEGDNNNTYKLYYPALDRTLEINFEAGGTHKINGWSETYLSGFGNNQTKLTTTATRMKTINSKYWSKNSIADSTLRIELKL
ncbi:MAG: hypothetical protein ACI865_001506 [Flavobacteriaceae bacterium]|jgi:hypothetical protein